MAKYTVQADEEFYRLVGPNGEEGPMVAYGELAVLWLQPSAPGQPPPLWVCLMEDPDDQVPQVFEVDSVSKVASEVEDVAFPPVVVKLATALNEAIEEAEGTTVDVEPGPSVN